MEHNDTRKVIIIGNGFDLAHDLKTRYYDFLVWYLNTALQKAMDASFKIHDDNLITLEIDNKRIDTFINDLSDIEKYHWLKLNFKSKLFEHIYRLSEKRWVDIEYELFAFIKDNAISVNNNQISPFRCIEKKIHTINDEFDFLKNKLIEYLKNIRI